MASVIAPSSTRSSAVSRLRLNLRMVRAGPLSASGGMMAFTRDPSGSRASTSGELSSTCRPRGATIRSIAPSTARGELKPFGARSRRPERST